MSEILVRDINPDVVEKLNARAEHNRHSLEAELLDILEHAVQEPAIDRLAQIERVRALFAGRAFDDSAKLVCEDRQR